MGVKRALASSATALEAEAVGTYSCAGVEGGVSKTNQDCAAFAYPFAKRPEVRACGVRIASHSTAL